MRVLTSIVLIFTSFGVANADGGAGSALIDVLGAENVLAFRAIDQRTYEFKILDEETVQASREWYESGTDVERRPTGAFRVGEVVLRGRDFLGVREFEHRDVTLIPMQRVFHVRIAGDRYEADHDGAVATTREHSAQEQDWEITVLMRQAELAAAQARVGAAQVALQEYQEGTFKLEEKKLEQNVESAQAAVRVAELELQRAEQLEKKGLAPKPDPFLVDQAKAQLEQAHARLHVLRNLTKQKMIVQFRGDFEAARLAAVAAEAKLRKAQEQAEKTGSANSRAGSRGRTR